MLSFVGEVRAYHVPHEYQSGRGLVIAPEVQHLRAERSILRYLTTYLLVQACQHLWLVIRNDAF